jgi:ATP-dependent protease ClpP protease subunit
MSLIKLPEIHADARLSGIGVDIRSDIAARWNPDIRAAEGDDNAATIGIYGVIGDTYDGTGWTAARVSGILRSVGADTPLCVNINSTGGDFFEGCGIYSLLRGHKAKVSVNVIGIAASAASVIAMAGDEVNISEAGFLMIHKAWTVAAGNADDMTKLAGTLNQFDGAMADLYAARAGIKAEDAMSMMAAETWIGAAQAVKLGFASAIINPDDITQEDSGNAKAKALVDASLARAGYSLNARAEIMTEIFTTGSTTLANPAQNTQASETDAETLALLAQLTATIKG